MTERETSNMPVNYQEQLAKEAAEISKRVATPSGDRVRFNGNRTLTTPDGNEGEEIEVVVVEFVSSNLFYDGAFDRDNPQPPGCFAIGANPSLLTPSDNSPNKQADTCVSCPNNQFGSAGKGKACKNTRLLAVMPVAFDGEDPPIWIMSVPPTSMKSFDAYVSALASKHKTVPMGVVTRITLDQGVTYAAPRFNVVRPLKSEEFETYMPRRDEATKRLFAEPDTTQYVPPKAAGNRGGVARRGVR